MTDAEALLWGELRRSNLDGLHFRRQQVVGGFIVDFYCHSIGLIIELDGGVHESQTAHNQDKERDGVLFARGLRVMRFKNEAVMSDLGKVLAQIVAAAKEQPESPLPIREGVGG